MGETRHHRLVQLLEQLLSEGWSQSSLAKTLSVDFTTVYRWLKGQSVPEEDSKNFHNLAKLCGSKPRGLELYLTGDITLEEYRKGDYEPTQAPAKKKKNAEKIKAEVLSKIYSLDPIDIAEIIASSAAYLARQV